MLSKFTLVFGDKNLGKNIVFSVLHFLDYSKAVVRLFVWAF